MSRRRRSLARPGISRRKTCDCCFAPCVVNTTTSETHSVFNVLLSVNIIIVVVVVRGGVVVRGN